MNDNNKMKKKNNKRRNGLLNPFWRAFLPFNKKWPTFWSWRENQRSAVLNLMWRRQRKNRKSNYSWVRTMPRALPSSNDVPVLLLNQPIIVWFVSWKFDVCPPEAPEASFLPSAAARSIRKRGLPSHSRKDIESFYWLQPVLLAPRR